MQTNWKHETAKSHSGSQSFINPANRNETWLLWVIFKMPHTRRHLEIYIKLPIDICTDTFVTADTRVLREVDSCRLR